MEHQAHFEAYLYAETRLEGRHVVHAGDQGDLLGLHHDGVDLEVRDKELRHYGPGGSTGAVRPEQIRDRVDASALGPGDGEPCEAR